MSNLFQDIENAIQAKLLADPWFWNQAAPADPPDIPEDIPASPNNVKTIQIDMPDTVAPVVDFTELFPDQSLPAVAVLAAVDNSTSSDATIGESRHDVPVKCLGVVKAYRKSEARNAAQELAENIIRVLQACRTSAGALDVGGLGNYVKSVMASVEVRPQAGARRHYGLVEVDATIVVVRPY